MANARNVQQKIAEAEYWEAFAEASMPGWNLYAFGSPRSAQFLFGTRGHVSITPHIHEIIVNLLGDRAPRQPEHWSK